MNRAERLAFASRSLGELLARDESAVELLEAKTPEPWEFEAAIRAAARSAGISGLRAEKRRRLAQIAAHDLAGEMSLTNVGEALAALADACLQVTLEQIEGAEALTVIAMGKLGGRELNYVSDIDI